MQTLQRGGWKGEGGRGGGGGASIDVFPSCTVRFRNTRDKRFSALATWPSMRHADYFSPLDRDTSAEGRGPEVPPQMHERINYVSELAIEIH